VKAFCGFVQYYNKFLLLYPLYALTKKSKRWKWTKECEQAFKEAKRLIASDRVLVHYNPNLPVLLACDASSYGISAVLSIVVQTEMKDLSIAFISRMLTDTEKRYSQVHKEGLALIWQ
jgi:hypothetical protein